MGAFVDYIFFFGATLPELPNWRFASFLASADTLTAFILAEQRIQNATLSFSSDKVFLQRAFLYGNTQRVFVNRCLLNEVLCAKYVNRFIATHAHQELQRLVTHRSTQPVCCATIIGIVIVIKCLPLGGFHRCGWWRGWSSVLIYN